MTENQKLMVVIIAYFGWTRVEEYTAQFYPGADLAHLTKQQTQKIVTELAARIPMQDAA